MEEDTRAEELTGPCGDCFYASWQDLGDGIMYYGCNMSHCYMADDEE